MKFWEKARADVFWLKDSLTGRQIRKYFKDISFILEGSPESINLRNEYLNALLRQATGNCRFYSGYKDFTDLKIFPVINKNLIRENQSAFMADNFKDKKLYSATTSGSTGTPFRIFHDRNKKLRNYADTLYFAGLTGYKPGQRLVYMKIWVKEKMRSPFAYRMQNIYPVDVIRLNDVQIAHLIRKMEKQKCPFSILGYASALESVCRYLDKINSGKVKTEICSVIAISEALNDYTRSAVKKYFGVNAFSRYSNLENGIIAQQAPGVRGKFLLNTASYHLEILNMESDEPVSEGETGRIVITDLFNYAMPMIRYDTGDIGSIGSDEIKTGRKYLTTVEGRKLDLLYDTCGNLVSSFLVYKNMWRYTEIDQYQLIQESEKKYIFRINIKSKFMKETQLVEEFKYFLGIDADFTVEYVSEIPLLSSGKRRKIVSMLKK